jgi:hypothetical protein
MLHIFAMDAYREGLRSGIKAFKSFDSKVTIDSYADAVVEAHKLLKIPIRLLSDDGNVDYRNGFFEGFSGEWRIWRYFYIP